MQAKPSPRPVAGSDHAPDAWDRVIRLTTELKWAASRGALVEVPGLELKALEKAADNVATMADATFNYQTLLMATEEESL